MKTRLILAAALAVGPVLGMLPSSGWAEQNAPTSIVCVEEDWQLQLGEPDPLTSSPQIGTQMNPNAGNQTSYAIFCLNFQQIPDFREGGLEIQLWEGDWNTDVNASENVKFSANSEVVTWTQEMRAQGGAVL